METGKKIKKDINGIWLKNEKGYLWKLVKNKNLPKMRIVVFCWSNFYIFIPSYITVLEGRTHRSVHMMGVQCHPSCVMSVPV